MSSQSQEQSSNFASSASGLSFTSGDFLDDEDVFGDLEFPSVTPGEYQSALDKLINEGTVAPCLPESTPHHPPGHEPISHATSPDPNDQDRRHSFDGVFPQLLATQQPQPQSNQPFTQVSDALPPIPQTAQAGASGVAALPRSSALSKRRLWNTVLEKFEKRAYPYSYFLLSRRPGKEMKADSLCMKCEFKVTGVKPNELREHLMCCPKLSLRIRRRIWRKSKSQNLPPLLFKPPREHTVAQLKRLFGCMDYTVSENGEDLQRDSEAASSADGNENPPKRLKLLPNRSIYDCTAGDAEMINKKVLAFIIDKTLPFATLKPCGQDLGSFHEIMEAARPGYVRYIPSQATLSNQMLNNMYVEVKKRVVDSLRVMLQSGYGTIMFDGWRDINSAPVVNVLIRVIGESRESSCTLFLGMVYTGAEACTAQRYVEIVEQIMRDYGGMARIAGIVTDNTSSCRNARNILAKKYGKLVASQDQAHVADLLMKDIGEIEWIETTLATLSPLPSILRTFAKLNQRLRELMNEYNKSVTANNKLCLSRFEDVVPLDFTPIMDDPDQYEEYPDREERERQARAQERAFLNTAIMMKPVSNVRFASSEKLLEEFVRLRPVLLNLINDNAFDSLYPARDQAQKKARQEGFINPIKDEAFLINVRNIRNIFYACRTYLRIFDGEGAISSDVYEAAIALRDRLFLLPESSFPHPCEENKKKLLAVVKNRWEGPLPGMKRVQIRLTSNLHTAAYLMDPYRCPMETCPPEMMERLRQHIGNYLDGMEIEDREKQSLTTELVLRYLDVRNKWRDISLFQSDQPGTGAKAFAENPIGWWLSGAVPSYSDEHKRESMKLLVEFAVRTLSVSPSACQTESSFSLQGRVHTKERSRLAQEKVRQLVFIKWNGSLFRKMRNAPEDDVWSRPTSQAENFERLSRERDNAIRRQAASRSRRPGMTRPRASSRPRIQRMVPSSIVPPSIVPPSIATSSPMLLTTSAVHTFVASSAEVQAQPFTVPPTMSFMGYPQRGVGRENQATRSGLRRSRRNSRVRTPTRYRGSSHSNSAGQSYSQMYEPVVFANPQYHSFVPVDVVTHVNQATETDEAEDENEEELEFA